MKFKTVILCLKLLTCLIVQRSFGFILVYFYIFKYIYDFEYLNKYSKHNFIHLWLTKSNLLCVCNGSIKRSSHRYSMKKGVLNFFCQIHRKTAVSKSPF